MPLFTFLRKTLLLIIEKTKKGYIVIRQSLNPKEEFLDLLIDIKETVLWFLRWLLTPFKVIFAGFGLLSNYFIRRWARFGFKNAVLHARTRIIKCYGHTKAWISAYPYIPFVIVFIGLYHLGYIDNVSTWLECKFSSPDPVVKSPLLNSPDPGIVKESLSISSEGTITISETRTSFFFYICWTCTQPSSHDWNYSGHWEKFCKVG